MLVATLGCSEDLGTLAASSGTDARPGDDGLSSTSESSTGADPCAGPFDYGPAASWSRFGLDLDATRFNTLERAIVPETVACVQPRWQLDGLAGVTGTPAVVGGTVVVGDLDGRVHARAVGDGTASWTAELGAAVGGSPCTSSDAVFVGDARGTLHALDRGDGTTLWSRVLDDHPDATIEASPVVASGRVIVGVSARAPSTAPGFRGSVRAVDAADGHELWQLFTAPADAGVPVRSSAAIDEGRGLLYLGTGTSDAALPYADALLAIRLATGAVAWSRRFAVGAAYGEAVPAPPGTAADLVASPNLFTAGERAVVGVGDRAGVYAALDRDTGETVWAVALGRPGPLGGIMASATVGDGRVWVAANLGAAVRDDGREQGDRALVYALDAESGTVLWSAPASQPIVGALTWAGGVIVHGGLDGSIHALDGLTGVALWHAQPGGAGSWGASVVDGTLWAGYGGAWSLLGESTEATGGLVAYGLPTP